MKKTDASRDYREKTIKGMIFDTHRIFPQVGDVTIRMTSDKIGQSLSLQCANIMIEIPLEAVTEIIRISEKER